MKSRRSADLRSPGTDQPSRRDLLSWAGLCSAQLLSGGLVAERLAAALPTRETVDSQPWGRLDELADGVWAMVSTPLASDDWTTVCNGGLIAGGDRLLAIESFATPAGARWLAALGRKLTRRALTDVVVTHFHGDHANGLEGFDIGERPRIWLTEATRELILDGDGRRQSPASDVRQEMLAAATPVDARQPTELDLGGRTVRIHPRSGHTPSDLTIELAEPSIVFCGDLVWNGFFPNYRDTTPTEFAASIRGLRRREPTVYVAGHGPLADGSQVEALLEIVDHIGEAAHRAFARGVPADEAAAEYSLPAAAADWSLFNGRYFEVAIEAWYRELR